MGLQLVQVGNSSYSFPSSSQLRGDGAPQEREAQPKPQESNLREVPDNQEVFAHPDTDQSLVIEIMEYQNAEDDIQAVRTYFEDLADTNGAEMEAGSVEYGSLDSSILSLTQCAGCQLLTGNQLVSKFRDTARNTVQIRMALLRLPQHQSDILITFNNPIFISPESSSNAAQSSDSPTAWTDQDFLTAVQSLTLIDEGLFG